MNYPLTSREKAARVWGEHITQIIFKKGDNVVTDKRGIRELRKELSDVIKKTQQGKRFCITKTDRPVAVLIGLKDFESMAKKGNKTALEEIRIIKRRSKRLYPESRKTLLSMLKHFKNRAKELRVSDQTLRQLSSLLIITDSVISRRPSRENKAFVAAIFNLMEKVLPEVIEKDFYFMNSGFLKKIEGLRNQISEKLIPSLNSKIKRVSPSLKPKLRRKKELALKKREELDDIIQNARTEKGTQKEIHVFTTALLAGEEIKKDPSDFEIITFLPFKLKSRSKKRFELLFSPFGDLFHKRRVEDKVKVVDKGKSINYTVLALT